MAQVPTPTFTNDIPQVAPKPKPKPKPKAPVDPYGGAVDPALLAAAQHLAQQQIDPVRQSIVDQQTQARQDALARQTQIQQANAALADLLKGIAPQIQQTYGQEADRQAMFGKGYSDALKQLQGQAADQSNQILANAGTGQTVQGDHGAADVLYGLGGAIPASTLSSQGAAFSSAAAFLPATALLRGRQDVMSAQGDWQKQNQDFLNQLKELEAKYPGITQDVYNNLVTQKSQKQAADLNRAITISELTGQVTPQAAKLLGLPANTPTLAAQKASADATKPSASLSKMFGYTVDQYGRPIRDKSGKLIPVNSDTSAPKVNVDLSKIFGWLVDSSGDLILKNGRPIRLPSPSKNKSKSKFTPGQIQKYSGQAYTIAFDFHNGYDYKDAGVTKHRGPQTYNAALRQMRRAGVPEKIARAILNHIYRPGELGRPMTYTTASSSGSFGVQASIPNG